MEYAMSNKAVEFIKTRFMMLIGKCKNSSFNNDGSTTTITSDVNNIVVVNNNRQNVPYMFPYGFCGLPNDNATTVILNSGVYCTNPIVIGQLTAQQNLPYNLQQGESFNYSNNWMITYQNNGIMAYQIGTQYKATLPSGEWIGKYLADVMSLLVELIQYIATHEHVAGSLVAGNTPVTGNTAAPVEPTPDYSNINDDIKSISNSEYLLNQNAKSLP
jgi:hypothetical protein